MITALEEQVEKLIREKEEALLLERRHSHFLENYEGCDFFTVEPLLELWVEKWMNQFSFLQTGTAFIASLEDKELKQKMYTQPKWAQLVVVSDGSERELISLLEEQTAKMTYPVGVVTLSEARALLEQEKQVESLIYPTAWSENMQTTFFEMHKREAGKALEEAMAYRRQKENELREIDQTLEKVKSFLETYSHEKHASLREESDGFKRQEMELVRNMEDAKDKLMKAQKEAKLTSETLRKEVEEKIDYKAMWRKQQSI